MENLPQIAQNCYRDFVASHDGQQPTADDMRTMIQQSTGVDVGEQEAKRLLNESK